MVFGINRPVIYDILKKETEGDLSDRLKAPGRFRKGFYQHWGICRKNG